MGYTSYHTHLEEAQEEMEAVREPESVVDSALVDVEQELRRAERKFPPFNSAHEGHSIILEELDELWDHVKANTAYTEAAYKEAIQVAAMGLRFALMVRARQAAFMKVPVE